MTGSRTGGATGYLDRMAARASGTAAAALPRLPSRFELLPGVLREPDPAAADGDPPRPAEPAEVAPPRARTATPPGAQTVQGSAREAQHLDVPEPMSGSGKPAAQSPVAPTQGWDGPAPATDETRVESRAADEPVTAPVGPLAQPAAVAVVDGPVHPPVPAVPAPSADAAPRAASSRPAEQQAASRQPDVVVVSVGRVDVRAVLAPAPQPAPRPRQAPADQLSLQDYLRGRREAR